MDYSIGEHRHRFAAWAAARAASTSACRFTVEKGTRLLASVTQLHDLCENIRELPEAFDDAHEKWCESISAKGACGTNTSKEVVAFSYGTIAKLINVYLKALTAPLWGIESEPDLTKKLAAVHPPIDSVLLGALHASERNVKRKAVWGNLRRTRWSNFTKVDYLAAISAIDERLKDERLEGKDSLPGRWRIESHWDLSQAKALQ